jgi:hypothetical protein
MLFISSVQKPGVDIKEAYPSSSLFEVTSERIRDSAELQRLVNKSCVPAVTEKHTGSADVFCQ